MAVSPSPLILQMPARVLPVIGARFTGKPRILHDTSSGLYEHSLPALSCDDEFIQSLFPPKKAARYALPKSKPA